MAKISCCSDYMIWNELFRAILFFHFFEFPRCPYRNYSGFFFGMNFIVQIPSRGIIAKLQIWLSEIEEREGNERWLLSLTPPRRAVVNNLSNSSGNRQDFMQAFLISFPMFAEALPYNLGIFKGPEAK